MRSADYTMPNPMGSREGSQIQTAPELMRLHAHQRQQGGLLRLAQEIKITQIRLNVFVNRVCLDLHTLY